MSLTDVGDDVGDEYPLSDDVIKSLRRHRPTFEELVECDDKMIVCLYALNCINQRQKKALQESTRSSSRNSLLLDMLMRRSVAAYKNFLICLDETKQSDIASLVTDDGGMVIVWPELRVMHYIAPRALDWSVWHCRDIAAGDNGLIIILLPKNGPP